jgi:hypothetical protein
MSCACQQLRCGPFPAWPSDWLQVDRDSPDARIGLAWHPDGTLLAVAGEGLDCLTNLSCYQYLLNFRS